jgi:hypothetical protein
MAKSDCCFNCVYAWRDLGQAMITLSFGFPTRPQCANQPGRYGLPTSTLIGKVCANYRARPAEPGADAKRIVLTNGMVAYVDAADYEELNQYTWHFGSGGYAARYDNRTLILMHRQIMNPPENMQVDHIHHNRLDNTRVHLRVCTASENARNRSKRGCASSRYFGVTYNKRRKKWVASIKIEGRVREVGYSHNEEEAARAHDYAAVRNFGDHVRLNFPEEWPAERRAEVRAQRDAEAAAANPDPPSSNTADREQKPEDLAVRPAGGVEREDEASLRNPHDAERTTKADDPAQPGPRVTS